MPLRDLLVSSCLLWWAGVGNDQSSAVYILGFYKRYERRTRNSRKIQCSKAIEQNFQFWKHLAAGLDKCILDYLNTFGHGRLEKCSDK